MSAQAVLEQPAPPTETTQFYSFLFTAIPGDESPLPPKIEVIGPASLTALTTDAQAEVQLTLTQQGLPPGTSVTFSEKVPIEWHAFEDPEKPILQPKWVTDLNWAETQISFTIENPATAKQAVIIGFTPVILYRETVNGTPVRIVVPDPTIVNIDPTGG